MTEINTATTATLPQPRLRLAFEKAKPKFTPLIQSDLLPMNFDPLLAVSTGRGALKQIMKHREAILALPGFNAEHLEQLETYALAAQYTQTTLLAADTPPERFAELVADATALRQRLLNDATALAQRGLIGDGPLQALKGPIGFRNIASDLGTLSILLRAASVRIAGKTCVTDAELDQAEVYSDEVIADVGERAIAPAVIAEVALERQKAFTLFLTTYDQVRRAVSYIRWNEDDVDTIAPSLFSGRKAKKTSSDVAAPQTGATPATTTNATPVAAAPTAGTPAITPVAKPGVGLPGADPFGN